MFAFNFTPNLVYSYFGIYEFFDNTLNLSNDCFFLVTKFFLQLFNIIGQRNNLALQFIDFAHIFVIPNPLKFQLSNAHSLGYESRSPDNLQSLIGVQTVVSSGNLLDLPKRAAIGSASVRKDLVEEFLGIIESLIVGEKKEPIGFVQRFDHFEQLAL